MYLIEKVSYMVKKGQEGLAKVLLLYSYGHSLTYGYYIGPMKMRSLRKSMIDPKNTARLLNWWYIYQMGLELTILSIWGL